jgi:exoribonuclease R
MRRGQTIYAPDRRTPLHPPVVSEGSASLLPGEVRPAFVWDMKLKSDGEGYDVTVYRAMVRSTDRFDYEGVQTAIDGGGADERLVLLKEVGEKRIEFERRRGGASLPMPEQEVNEDDQGHYRLGFRPPLQTEDWNAQISLMTGMAAAELMIRAKVGVLRTMPPADQGALDRFRRAGRALGVEWQKGTPYGEFLRGLDRTNPKHLALIHEATSLFRGAGYTVFDGEPPQGDGAQHAAVAYVYSHVTAPLRRLVDRFGLAICEAVCDDQPVPDWVRAALPQLPDVMAASDKKAGAVERACADAVEAAALADLVGQEFDAMVVDLTEKKDAVVQVSEPAVIAKASGRAELGTSVKVKLVEATVATGVVHFAIVS